VRFTEATCPTPFCSPSRASIVTGLYPHTHGIVTNVNRRDYPHHPPPANPNAYQRGIMIGDLTTDSLLHDAGWQTHHYGKWHLLEHDLRYYADMFTEHGAYAAGMADTFAQVRERPRESWMDWYGWALPVTVSPALQAQVDRLGERWNDRIYAEFITKMGRLELPLEQSFDVQVADHTIARLGQLGPEPFSLTCSFNYPHDPNVVPAPYYDRFDPDVIELPANWGRLDERFAKDWSREVVTTLGEPMAREFLRIYYASVKLIDDQVGRVLDALGAAGRADETIVVFLSDHGDMAGGHGMIWKSSANFYEELVRVPLILSWPGRLQPQVTELPASLVDLLPTLLELCRQPIPEEVQGHSLAPFLLGQRLPEETPTYTFSERVGAHPEGLRTLPEGTRGSFMVRGDGWKLVRYADGREQLFDLEADPGEVRNLAADPGHQARLHQMRWVLAQWLAQTRFPAS
jgi:arylsulfatase A-like enzyme